MSSFAVARDMFVHQDNFLLVDIGGEMTDIAMIKKDVLRESISFPMGRNFMVRGVAKALDCTLIEAGSFLSLYKDGHAEESALKKLKPVIEKLKSEWLKEFQESLANLSTDISIPATIFITVDQELTDFFSEIIKTEQFSQYTLTESKFRVIFLGTQALHGIATFEENAVRDSFLIIESIYINRFLR
jgi:cell division ATPase FtsA